MRIGNGNEIIAVDDSKDDLFIIEVYYKKSKYQNKFVGFGEPEQFLTFMGDVDRNDLPIPALVLLDINMPKMNGFEVLQEIKAIPKFADVPIFFTFSNSDRLADKEKSLELGARDFLSKMDLSKKDFFDTINHRLAEASL